MYSYRSVHVYVQVCFFNTGTWSKICMNCINVYMYICMCRYLYMSTSIKNYHVQNVSKYALLGRFKTLLRCRNTFLYNCMFKTFWGRTLLGCLKMSLTCRDTFFLYISSMFKTFWSRTLLGCFKTLLKSRNIECTYVYMYMFVYANTCFQYSSKCFSHNTKYAYIHLRRLTIPINVWERDVAIVGRP